MPADPPAWLAGSRCGATARRIDAFLAHVRECQGKREVVVTDAEVISSARRRRAAAGAGEPQVTPPPTPRPPKPKAKKPAKPRKAAREPTRKKRPTPAERWVSARARYPDATLKEIADREGVTPGAVWQWRKAAVAAGLEQEQDWRALGQEARAKRAPTTKRLKGDARWPGKSKASPAPVEMVERAAAPVESATDRRVLTPGEAASAVRERLAVRGAARADQAQGRRGATAQTMDPPRSVSLVVPPEPGAVPSLRLTANQAAIMQRLYDGKLLLFHAEAKDAWWEEHGRGMPLNAGALAGLRERGLVAPYGFETSARIRRLMLTDEGRLTAGRIEFEAEEHTA